MRFFPGVWNFDLEFMWATQVPGIVSHLSFKSKLSGMICTQKTSYLDISFVLSFLLSHRNIKYRKEHKNINTAKVFFLFLFLITFPSIFFPSFFFCYSLVHFPHHCFVWNWIHIESNLIFLPFVLYYTPNIYK